MKRDLFIISSLILIIIIFLLVLSSALVQPGPHCNIKGVIEDVEFEEAWEHECIKKERETGMPECPDGGFLSYPNRYSLGIRVDEVFTVEVFNEDRCEYEIKGGDLVYFNVPLNLVKEGDDFMNGRKIEVDIDALNWRSISSYNLGEKLDESGNNYVLYIIIGIILIVIILTLFFKQRR